jgi:hypothetical protein
MKGYLIYLLFSLALQPSAGYGLLVSRGSLITHNDAPQSVGLLWTNYKLVAENKGMWRYIIITPLILNFGIRYVEWLT